MPGYRATPMDQAERRKLMVLNQPTALGALLGTKLAQLCDAEAAKAGRDGRCGTCAFRAGDHPANGSPETQMNALKCVLERTLFLCHEPGREHEPCAGWLLMRSDAGSEVRVPWAIVDGFDDPADRR